MKKDPLLRELEIFLAKYLPHDRKLSRTTILSYRDTFKLFLRYILKKSMVQNNQLNLDVLSYETVLEFLASLEKVRNCTAVTRNQRLAAIKSFAKFLLVRCPDFSASISRVLAIPAKKTHKQVKHFLDDDEVEALLTALNGPRWIDQRNTLMFKFMIQTGARISELTDLRIDSLCLTQSPFVKIIGKGRKERSIPISSNIAKKLKDWLKTINNSDFAFPTASGNKLSSDAIQYTLQRALTKTMKVKTSLVKKHITVHSMRRTAAMRMLNNDVDIYIIAIWLGHEKIATTEKYLTESMSLKRKALEKIPDIGMKLKILRQDKDQLLFLDDI